MEKISGAKSEQNSPPVRPLPVALADYRQALAAVGQEAQTWLDLLLARDRVEAVLQSGDPPQAEEVQSLAELDRALSRRRDFPAVDILQSWRRARRPPESHWWWYPEQAQEQNDLFWRLAAGGLTALTLPLAVEIIRRLWDGAPDAVSFWGALLTLLLTGSPFTRQGQQVIRWLLRRVSLQVRAKAEAAMALLAFILVLGGRLALPSLAVLYNERGLSALRAGNLAAAQHSFQRAVALDPDFAVGYYHLADVYEETGRPEEAVSWYQRALERNLNLAPAYSSLGRLYLLQGDSLRAWQVLQTGLHRTTGDTEADDATRYRLLSLLGWAYTDLGEPALARKVLEEAVALEKQLAANFRSAVPHYYLALTYEALGEPALAIEQWEDSLRYLDPESPEQVGWMETVQAHLKLLREAN